MYQLKKFDVWASEIAGYLNNPLEGEDFIIKNPHFILTPRVLKGHILETSAKTDKTLLIAEKPIPGLEYTAYIPSLNPDLDFAYVLREFFATSPIHEIHKTAVVSKSARLGRNVLVGAHSVIGPDVEIDDNTKIYNNVVIHGPVSIGKFCVIKDGAVIGSEGWNFIEDEEGNLFHPPQLGNILIEDRVWIGSNSSIERAMVEQTKISANVRIDDLVHIGAGSQIGEKSELMAGLVLATHVIIGKNVKIAPHAVIRENIHIADDVIVGQGAVVVKDLAAGNVYVGNPARLLRKAKAQGGDDND